MRKARSLGSLQRVILGMTVLALCVAFAPQLRAGVTRVEITSKQDVLGGKTFGTVGAYEKLKGKVYFAIDPNNPHNKIIADLDKAPKDAQGKVEFSADIFIIRPKDPSHGNGSVIFDIPNRGHKGVLSSFNRAKGSNDPTTEEEFGDGFLMRLGYTVVAIGWEFDIPKAPDLVLLTAPVAAVTDALGNVYIADAGAGSIRIVDAAGAVGVKECDDYMKKWADCYKDPAMKAAAKPALDQTVAAWKQAAATPQGKTGLATSCKMMLDNFPSASCK